MQQNPSGGNLQVYASLSTIKVEPPQNEMTKGVVPLDTLPAGWWNWLWNAITQAQNNAQYSLDTVYQEINAVLTHAGITPDPTQFDQLKQAIIKLRTQIATAIDVGSVLSTETGTNGSVKVAADGKMTVNGFGDLQQLQTLMKDTLVEAINEVFNVASVLDGEVGDLTTLATENKTTIVSAINELKEASGEGAAALEGKIGNMDNLQTTDKSSLVSAINEVNDKEITLSGQISPRFTYVVDSDQALLDWANNVSGNDYSTVLIRRGTWTSTKGVNLTTSGTKVVVGDAGSKLVFNGVEKGLYYNTTPTTSDYWMRDVTIKCSGISSSSSYVYGFHSCTNLVNCNSTCTTVSSSPNNSYGFCDCTNLINCTGTGDSTCTGDERAFGTGFQLCTNLINCTGIGKGTGGRIYTPDAGTGVGFGTCYFLTSCKGTGTGTGTGDSQSDGKGVGFEACYILTSCKGTGTGTGISNSSSGYGFSDCVRVSGCKKDAKCTTDVFRDSYASYSKTSTYTCSDTPEGGFNNTTN